MKELIDVIRAYGVSDILIIFVAFCAGLKCVVEAYEWCKSRLEKQRQVINGKEKKEQTVEDRIILLQQKDKDIDEDIAALKQQDKEMGKDIKGIQTTLDYLGKQVLEIILDRHRETILDFADIATDPNRYPSREKYNNVFSIYQRYEDLLSANGMSNGQAEISIELIRESYKTRMEKHTFLEDMKVKVKPNGEN